MSCLSLLLATSIHIGLAGNYNQLHPHVRCEIKQDEYVSTIFGAYRNSESNTGYYFGKKIGNVELGLVSGYSVQPIIPLIRFTYNGWFIMPALEADNRGILLGYEMKLF